MADEYSPYKIIWFPEKLKSFREGVIKAPLYVRIKPINRCNHSCFFCVYHESPEYSGMHEEMIYKDVIDKDKLFEVLDDLGDMGVKAVTYSGGGEPLLYKHIVDTFKRTKKNNLDLSIITNGHLLNGERAEQLAEAKWVRVSIDYWDGQSLKDFRSIEPKCFDVIMNNIQEFAKNRSSSCNISVNYIITKHNYHKIYDVSKMLKGLNIDNVRFGAVWTTDYVDYHKPFRDEVLSQLKKAKTDFETNSFKVFASYNVTKDVHIRPYKKCFVMQTIPVLGADGLVYACHNKAYDKTGLIGSVRDKTFKELWFSKETKKLFDEFDANKICVHQCANDQKNILINKILQANDNFV